MNTSFLNLKNEKYRHEAPWEHYVIDNFFSLGDFKKIQKSLCTVKEGYQKRDNDVFDLNFMLVPDFNLLRFFLSGEFQQFLEILTQSQLELYEKGLVQLRLMTPESPAFKPHVDDQDERSLVCLFYLSPDWEPKKGGELILHKNEKAEPDESKVLSPMPNRMVLFFSDDTNWHSVNRVYDWNRYSIISEWIVKERGIA